MKLTTAKGHYVEIPYNELHTHTGHAYEKYGHCALKGGMWWCSCMKHYNTSQKVAGSIPDGIPGIFH